MPRDPLLMYCVGRCSCIFCFLFTLLKINELTILKALIDHFHFRHNLYLPIENKDGYNCRNQYNSTDYSNNEWKPGIVDNIILCNPETFLTMPKKN